MVAANYNIILEQKADFSRSFKIQLDNADLDITGYSFNATLKERIQSDSGHDFTVSVADSATGTITMTMTDEQTGAIKPGDYVYDLVMTDDAGLKTRLIQGMATVTGGITG
jgi:hypothetical protein